VDSRNSITSRVKNGSLLRHPQTGFGAYPAPPPSRRLLRVFRVELCLHFVALLHDVVRYSATCLLMLNCSSKEGRSGLFSVGLRAGGLEFSSL
jgi:hypothetical protein